MAINTDTITTVTGTLTSIFGTAAYFGVFPKETAIAAGVMHALNSYFSKGLTKK